MKLWLLVAAPKSLEFLPGTPTKPNPSLIHPEDPAQLPLKLGGKPWPPPDGVETPNRGSDHAHLFPPPK